METHENVENKHWGLFAGRFLGTFRGPGELGTPQRRFVWEKFKNRFANFVTKYSGTTFFANIQYPK